MPRAQIDAGFWHERLEVNARRAIFHQWEQLVASGCIENFRIAAGEVEGLRVGWFFADSDAYKWLDAAAQISAGWPDARLTALMDDLIELIGRAQAPDGYIFTYNQIHFPGTRWHNLQIEHELYCHGHLIEAGVAHFRATGSRALLDIARRAADRVVADFSGKGPEYTPGHEEIELALLRLHEITPGDRAYLEMARQFIEQRGRAPGFVRSLLRQNQSAGQRRAAVRQQKDAYLAAHPDYRPYQLPPDNPSKQPRFSRLRWYASALSGKYFQQHAPIREQREPVGHSVRFAYLQTAAAMLARHTGDGDLLDAQARVWEAMVARRMYVTGGIGAAPGLEGFGRDFELDPEYAYAETCAALGSLFWNWEMAQATGEARYSELFEWQLYNAAAVGMGLDGSTYLYNNPLACREAITRLAWYSVPCCPSNLSRTWAGLGQYLYSIAPGEVRLHQYIGSTLEQDGLRLELESGLPWEGRARLAVKAVRPEAGEWDLLLRQPVWAASMRVSVNGAPAVQYPAPQPNPQPAGSGFDPRAARFLTLRRAWQAGDVVEIGFDMPVRLLRAHPRVRGHAGKVAVTRGPLVYCLESVDNPGVDIFSARLDPGTLVPVHQPDVLGGCTLLYGKSTAGAPLAMIPYMLWGNRGSSRMTVWVSV